MLALAAVALAAFAFVEFAKAASPWTIPAEVKIALAGLICGVWLGFGGASLEHAGGALGLAMVFHRLHRFLGAAGDHYRVQVVRSTMVVGPR